MVVVTEESTSVCVRLLVSEQSSASVCTRATEGTSGVCIRATEGAHSGSVVMIIAAEQPTSLRLLRLFVRSTKQTSSHIILL